MHRDTEAAFDVIDAGFYSGDEFYDEEVLIDIEDKLLKWLTRIAEIRVEMNHLRYRPTIGDKVLLVGESRAYIVANVAEETKEAFVRVSRSEGKWVNYTDILRKL